MLYLSVFGPTHDSFLPVTIAQCKLSCIAESIISVSSCFNQGDSTPGLSQQRQSTTIAAKRLGTTISIGIQTPDHQDQWHISTASTNLPVFSNF